MDRFSFRCSAALSNLSDALQLLIIKNISRFFNVSSANKFLVFFIFDKNFSFGLSNQHRRLLRQTRKVLFLFEYKLIGEVCLFESISSDLVFLNNCCFTQIKINRAISLDVLVSC